MSHNVEKDAGLTDAEMEALCDAFVAANRAEFLDTDYDVPIQQAIERIVAARVRQAAPLIRRAINDPGSFVKRGADYDGEPYRERLDQWQNRAIEAALTTVTPPEVTQ